MSENSSCLKQKEAPWQCNLFIFFGACGNALTVEQSVPVCLVVSLCFICISTVVLE